VIRIGYFSADFRNHPVSLLTTELFETHDRTKFETFAFSTGPDTKDAVRSRLKGAFNEFIDARNHSDRSVAEHARRLEIDIAIDLGGHTQDSRTGIFAMRAAPLQVNFLGYPGTMGAAYMDYLVADHMIIPESHRRHYSEKIAYLPSYQPNDSRRAISAKELKRQDFGLPQTGFVFCCFNNHYKITPGVFDVWMRILKRVDGSVMWLSGGHGSAADNLRNEASLRGIAADRLIFAEPMPMLEEHLARHRLADLFLDTLPFNAHTTASDALWAGLPVLTCTAEAFASRVAASLLTAIDLPELITSTQAGYEALAITLAANPERLAQIRKKLEANRLTMPLFDARQFTKNIEDAYAQMYERHQADLPPGHIYVTASASGA
jgi:predicted O-linked N-acetylglucosamine transferase (SPINDLY family)